MKSFLLKNKTPIIKWGMIPNNVYFEGKTPQGYNLAVCPCGLGNYIVLDVDVHSSSVNGFDNIPIHLLEELNNTFSYSTKNKGKHYWFKYTGNKQLMNKASGLSIDLRTEKGYVVWYPLDKDIREVVELNLISNTSKELNGWLERLFTIGKRLKIEIK